MGRFYMTSAMGGFYITYKVIPVFRFVSLYGKILRKVKVLT